MRDFRDRIALITGASSGIGAALAAEFARRGADVALLARRVERLDSLADRLGRETGRRLLPILADVTRDGDLERALERALAAFGRLDVAVANAGFGVAGRFEGLSLDDYRRQFETNVFGVIRTVRATLPALKQTRGSLALMGSVSGYVSAPGLSAYAMSKFSVRALADALREELVPTGVSVTLISPGFVVSEIRKVDKLGAYHEDASDPVSPRLALRTDVAARQIADAIAKRRAEIVVTWHGKAMVFVARHFPRTMRAATRTMTAGIRKV